MLSALLIAMREGLEAALIIGIVLGYLNRTGSRRAIVFAWAGIAAAALVSAALAVGMRTVGADLETPYEQLFEGTTMLLAVAVLTWMVFWMRYQGRYLKPILERKMQMATGRGYNWGIATLAFVAVLREGVEMALFLAANAFAADAGATLSGALIGLALAAAAGVLIYVYAVRLNLSLFFEVTSLLLVMFAAGLLAGSIREFQEIGLLPVLTGAAWDLRTLLGNETPLGAILHSLIGYDDHPSLLQVATYVGYWVILLQAVRWWTRRLGTRLLDGHA